MQDVLTIDSIRAQVNAERWLVARLVAAILDVHEEVTATAVVDHWEALGVLWTDRRDAFGRVKRELRRMLDAGHIVSDEVRQVRQVRPWGPPRRIYRRPS